MSRRLILKELTDGKYEHFGNQTQLKIISMAYIANTLRVHRTLRDGEIHPFDTTENHTDHHKFKVFPAQG